MKNLFKKISATILIIVFGILFFPNFAFAVGPATATPATPAASDAPSSSTPPAENLGEPGTPSPLERLMNALDGITPCVELIKADGTPGTDADKIITIVEEPIGEVGANFQNENFQVRRCFRHTVVFANNEKKPITVSKVAATTCPLSSAQSLEGDRSLAAFNPKYFCKEVQVYVSTGGTSLLYGYIGTIYRWGAGLVGVIAVLVIVFSGIQISAAGGDPDAVNSAKRRILQSISGIVVLFLSGLILYTINPNFFRADSPQTQQTQQTQTTPTP